MDYAVRPAVTLGVVQPEIDRAWSSFLGAKWIAAQCKWPVGPRLMSHDVESEFQRVFDLDRASGNRRRFDREVRHF
jgi:hypothetical protein